MTLLIQSFLWAIKARRHHTENEAMNHTVATAADRATKHVIVYGPPACGKTTNARALAAFFGKTKVVDFDARAGLGGVDADTLVLTNVPMPGAIHFDDAMRLAETAAMKPKLCINCRHHLQVDQPVKGMSEHQCSHPRHLSPVDGSPANCLDARRSARHCGPDGSLFVEILGNPVQRH